MTKAVEIAVASTIIAGLVLGGVSCRAAIARDSRNRSAGVETRAEVIARIEARMARQRLFMNLSYVGFGVAGAGFLTGLALGLAEGNIGASKELVGVTVQEKYSYVDGELRTYNSLSEGAKPYLTLRLADGSTREYRASAPVFNRLREGDYGTAVLKRGRVIDFRGAA